MGNAGGILGGLFGGRNVACGAAVCSEDHLVDRFTLEAATAMDERDGTDVTMVAGLYEMAKDEYSHAYFLKKYLDDHNVDVPETCEKSFKDLEIQIKKVFR